MVTGLNVLGDGVMPVEWAALHWLALSFLGTVGAAFIQVDGEHFQKSLICALG